MTVVSNTDDVVLAHCKGALVTFLIFVFLVTIYEAMSFRCLRPTPHGKLHFLLFSFLFSEELCLCSKVALVSCNMFERCAVILTAVRVLIEDIS